MQNTPTHGYSGFEKTEDLIFDYYPVLKKRYGNASYYIREPLLRQVLDPSYGPVLNPLGVEWRGYTEEELFGK